MEALALRLVLPPLVIAGATLAQSRLGDRLGGLVVGLPLTSGTFLSLILLSDGRSAVSEATKGMLAGQVSVILMAVAYSYLAPRTGVALTLVGAVVAWALTVPAILAVDDTLTTAAVYLATACIALALWPTSGAVEGDSPPVTASASHTTFRVGLGSALVIALTAGVQLLGPNLAGTLSAAPLVALVVSPTTHGSRGAAAVRVLLQGVVRGSAGAAAFALVLLATVGALGGPAIVLACGACLAVVTLISRRSPADHAPPASSTGDILRT